MNVTKRNGSQEPLDIEKIHKVVAWACQGLDASQSAIELDAHLMFFDNIKTADIHDALIKAAASLISPSSLDYSKVAARLLLQKVYKEVVGDVSYPPIKTYIDTAYAEGRIDKALANRRPEIMGFDYERLDAAIDKDRDLLFDYLGLQTIVDRYLIRAEQVAGAKTSPIIELPQHFWMRVAMGLAIYESQPTEAAISFYNVLSKLEFVSSTPTLFNSGTNHPQLSSCYLNTVADQISNEEGQHRYASIYGTIEECANLSKFAGGIGTDWTRVRAAGDVIKSTNGKSSGIVPYLKVFNDTAVAVNQGGKRNGAFAAYLEPWHPDFLDFLELRKNSGDERRRAHDIFPAAWIPDLFFKRVEEGGVWSFFSPKENPSLHELHGKDFEDTYRRLEAEGKAVDTMPALELWKRILTSLFETGHPWITFKDECNRRNPQSHVGVIHGSNLCTEITLNTSDDETAVCNLGSVNLSRIENGLHLRQVIRTGMRMLDNVIDINFYPSDRAANSNLQHRPVGMGVMGYTEWLVKNGIDWESEEHLDAADGLFEAFSYYAIEASADLAEERGAYKTFKGSKWSQGVLPIDTARSQSSKRNLDWDGLRRRVIKGMRNSNVMAVAPTATIANIAGTTPCIEPIFERQYTKSNLSGSFIVADPCLRYGRPELCKEAFEINPRWIVLAAARRQKWIDQAQSVNIFVRNGIRGSELAEIYLLAWREGLKTTYYLRSQSKQVKPIGEMPVAPATVEQELDAPVVMCSIDNPNCESCQ